MSISELVIIELLISNDQNVYIYKNIYNDIYL